MNAEDIQRKTGKTADKDGKAYVASLDAEALAAGILNRCEAKAKRALEELQA